MERRTEWIWILDPGPGSRLPKTSQAPLIRLPVKAQLLPTDRKKVHSSPGSRERKKPDHAIMKPSVQERAPQIVDLLLQNGADSDQSPPALADPRTESIPGTGLPQENTRTANTHRKAPGHRAPAGKHPGTGRPQESTRTANARRKTPGQKTPQEAPSPYIHRIHRKPSATIHPQEAYEPSGRSTDTSRAVPSSRNRNGSHHPWDPSGRRLRPGNSGNSASPLPNVLRKAQATEDALPGNPGSALGACHPRGH